MTVTIAFRCSWLTPADCSIVNNFQRVLLTWHREYREHESGFSRMTVTIAFRCSWLTPAMVNTPSDYSWPKQWLTLLRNLYLWGTAPFYPAEGDIPIKPLCPQWHNTTHSVKHIFLYGTWCHCSWEKFCNLKICSSSISSPNLWKEMWPVLYVHIYRCF